MTAEEELDKLKKLIELSITNIQKQIRNGCNEYRFYHELDLLKDLHNIIEKIGANPIIELRLDLHKRGF